MQQTIKLAIIFRNAGPRALIFCMCIPCGQSFSSILNETSKPPVNKTHFFNIAHLLLNCLK